VCTSLSKFSRFRNFLDGFYERYVHFNVFDKSLINQCPTSLPSSWAHTLIIEGMGHVNFIKLRKKLISLLVWLVLFFFSTYILFER